jgi:hypothetical protein
MVESSVAGLLEPENIAREDDAGEKTVAESMHDPGSAPFKLQESRSTVFRKDYGDRLVREILREAPSRVLFAREPGSLASAGRVHRDHDCGYTDDNHCREQQQVHFPAIPPLPHEAANANLSPSQQPSKPAHRQPVIAR